MMIEYITENFTLFFTVGTSFLVYMMCAGEEDSLEAFFGGTILGVIVTALGMALTELYRLIFY